MNALTRFDTNSLAQLNRALIGFDRIFHDAERRFANSPQTNYPPFNILKHDDDHFEMLWQDLTRKMSQLKWIRIY